MDEQDGLAARRVAQRGKLTPPARRGARGPPAPAGQHGRRECTTCRQRRRLPPRPRSTILPVLFAAVPTATSPECAATAASGGPESAVILRAITWSVGTLSAAAVWRVVKRRVHDPISAVSPERRRGRDAGQRLGASWTVWPRSTTVEHGPKHGGRSAAPRVTVSTDADFAWRRDDSESSPPNPVSNGFAWRHR